MTTTVQIAFGFCAAGLLALATCWWNALNRIDELHRHVVAIQAWQDAVSDEFGALARTETTQLTATRGGRHAAPR